MPAVRPDYLGEFSQDQQTAPYIDYKIRTAYEWDSGVLDMPVAYQAGQAGPLVNPVNQAPSQRTQCEQIQVAAPKGQKVVTFSATRLGLPPQVPDPTPPNSNETLLTAKVVFMEPMVQPDGGSYAYGVEGIYVYSLKAPIWTGDGQMVRPACPVSKQSKSQVPYTQFQAGMQ